jgi:hypothetical protein
MVKSEMKKERKERSYRMVIRNKKNNPRGRM